jgi:putative mRNA 3-end processing factor
MRAADILMLTPAGLYCEAGDFYVDPVLKVARAVITHGHSDHARRGHEAVLATAETLDVMAVRYGEKFAGQRQTARLGETIAMGNARVMLKPAGHVIGSAQVLIEVKGARVVVSGDYKRARDPTCPAFEPTPCDVFITEATFGLPVFRHPPAEGEVAKLLRSLALFPERAHFVGAYSLGKAQRLIALLREAGHHDPIFVDPATERLCAVYTAHNIDLGALSTLVGQTANALAGKVVIAPPSARSELFADADVEPITSFASGWMRTRKRAQQGGGELPLIISDHADWDELTQTAREIGPSELWITHGEEAALIHWARSNGMAARPLAIRGYGDEEAAAT